MYLARLTLNPRSAGARRDLAEPYCMHQTLRWAYPGAGEDAAGPLRRVLWRADGMSVIVQSHDEPDFSVYAERSPGYLIRPAEVKPLDLGAIARTGWVYAFTLRANPVKTVRVPGRRHGSRRPVHGQTDQLAWLGARAERSGFRIVPGSASVLRSDTTRTRPDDAGVSVIRTDFRGTLEVIDAAAFAHTLAEGIGRERHLGLGMLTLRRV